MMEKANSRNIRNLSRYFFAGVLLAFCQNSGAENPESFTRQFANFKFAYHEKIQDPNVFLSSRSGDCDDFATLADGVLRGKGYSPRLFAVRMKEETHVVCYVPETRAYLDYNNRSKQNPLVFSNGAIEDIAGKVAKSFGSNWLAAYEFTYQNKAKWLVNTIQFNKTQPEPLLAKK